MARKRGLLLLVLLLAAAGGAYAYRRIGPTPLDLPELPFARASIVPRS